MDTVTGHEVELSRDEPLLQPQDRTAHEMPVPPETMGLNTTPSIPTSTIPAQDDKPSGDATMTEPTTSTLVAAVEPSPTSGAVPQAVTVALVESALPSLPWPSNESSTQPIQVPSDIEPSSKTEVLKVLKVLEAQDTEDLVNTIQTLFENDPTVRDAGVILLDAPHLLPAEGSIKLPPTSYRFEATAQRVHTPAKLVGKGLVVIKDDKAELKVQYPKFSEPKDLTPDEMEQFFQKNVEAKREQARHQYFNVDLSDYTVRPNSPFELTCGSPMDKLSYIAGMTTPYGYYSRSISQFGAHVEDWHCASYNVLFAGETKLWIAVKPSSQQLLETKIREMFPESGTCVQFIRHLAINIAPSTLREWGVEHCFVPQKPGQIVAVTGFTYHWGINTGQNYAEAINFCLERDWKASETFKNCYPGCGINMDNLPLPMPVLQEGSLEYKKSKAFERDAASRQGWEKEVRAFLEAEEAARDASKKPPSSKKPRLSNGRKVSDTPARGDSEVPAGSRKLTKGSPADRIEVHAAASLQYIGRGNVRTAAQRKSYRFSSPSEAGSTDEDDLPAPPKPFKAMHSRHNSSNQFPQPSHDIKGLSNEVHAIKNSVLGFLMDQKQSAAKHEEHVRTQIAFQQKLHEDNKRQLEYSARLDKMSQDQLQYQRQQDEHNQHQSKLTMQMTQSVQRMEHNMMRLIQQLETQNKLVSESRLSSNAPSEVYAPSATSVQPSDQQPLQHSSARSRTAHNPLAGLGIVNHQSQFREYQDQRSADFQARPRPPQDSPVIRAMPAPIKGATHSTGASGRLSRRPSTVALSERASEADAASLDLSPLTPYVKSMHSTPQVDTEAESSAPSSLSEVTVDDGTIVVQSRSAKKAARRSAAIDDDMTTSNVNSDSEYMEKPRKKTSRKSSTLANAQEAGGVVDGPAKCVSCQAHRWACHPAPEGPCSGCAKRNLKCSYELGIAEAVQQQTKDEDSTSKTSLKRSAEESFACPAIPDAKKAKSSAINPPVDSVESQVPAPVTKSTPMASRPPPRGDSMARELMSLGSTSESILFQPPSTSRRDRSSRSSLG